MLQHGLSNMLVLPITLRETAVSLGALCSLFSSVRSLSYFDCVLPDAETTQRLQSCLGPPGEPMTP